MTRKTTFLLQTLNFTSSNAKGGIFELIKVFLCLVNILLWTVKHCLKILFVFVKIELYPEKHQKFWADKENFAAALISAAIMVDFII